MALEKSITLASGVVGEYWRVQAFNWDRNLRELSAHFVLFVSSSIPGGPPGANRPIMDSPLAKLRVSGAQFDTYFGAAALAAAANDVIAQIYEAAKDACDDYHTTGATDGELYVVCDAGKDIFWDATDV